ncbi:MAG: ATP-binding cassette domain-containing protein [Acidimicrobiia bacterium]|nr:ATP-binding cassette domain-containing protein [Acidimicrobiia bacterium]MDH3396597.1 ATP-binding cassette domain-containing protein [Acidimicrobiia bacterium]MDH5615389.1 ATP-binding cassette domain-containing protein [Acidimicrobiia bacterium]
MAPLVVEGLRFPADGSIVSVERLSVEAGGRLIIFGPNGAGKTTLLRLLAGVLPGGPLLGAAYQPQHSHLFRGSAGWNLGLGLNSEQAARARTLADRFGLDPALYQEPASALSGGERQRLSLARTLARPEPWVLLDEPLAALDVADRVVVAAALVDSLSGKGAIIVTHDREEAAVLGERVAVMVGGTIAQEGPVAEVFSLPVDDRVAKAVGVANVLDGVAGSREGPLCSIRVGALHVWGLGDLEEGAGARVLFGAEAVTLFPGHDASAGSARNRWPGTVAVLRETGRLIEVIVDAGSPIAALITPGSREALQLAPGAPVTLTVKATAVRVIPR